MRKSRAGAEIRILLFDIDGTLLSAVERGVYRARIKDALIEIFGTAGTIDEVRFDGKTDLQIVGEALEQESIRPQQIRDALPLIESGFISVLNELSRNGPVFKQCPGVGSLLDRLALDSRYVLSLLTGNIEKLAHAKLESVGLSDYFRFRGAFGSDNEDRLQLPAVASRRIAAELGEIDLEAKNFIIIGDTPRDVACARHFGAQSVAVASGAATRAELEETRPDLLFDDLSDTEAVMAALSTL